MYMPLDLVGEETRVLVLHPAGHHDDPIIAQLAYVPLYGYCVYDALSYTWGSNEATTEILLESQQFR